MHSDLSCGELYIFAGSREIIGTFAVNTDRAIERWRLQNLPNKMFGDALYEI